MMTLNSLALRSNMIFARHESEIIERESYIVVKTLSNPEFHWGNYLIFKKAPVDGDLVNWINLFQREHSHYKEFRHYVFAWDEPVEPKSLEYLSHGFTLEKSISLRATSLKKPLHYNIDIVVRPLANQAEWDAAIELQTATREPHFSYEEYKSFVSNKAASYQKLVSKNQGARFGAFLNNVLVADLGIYFEKELARYQSVVTHPDYRGKGICATLVYESGQYALKNWSVSTLAMEADPDYHAARIYESVGFTPMENSYNLYWYIGKN